MARRRSNTSVSLFPFLAVLVCTMGALILLLLVTTRRIRQKQAVVEVPAPITVPERSSSSSTLTEALSRQIVDASQSVGQLKRQHTELTQQLQEAEDAKDAAREKLDKLESAAATLQDDLDNKDIDEQTEAEERQAAEQQLTRLRQRSQKLSEDLAEITTKKDLCEKRLIALKNQQAETEQLTGEYHSALVSLRRLITDRQHQPKDFGLPKTVIDFTNPDGTARSPIVVEVDGAGYRLAATDILIRHEDLKGCSSTDNPLLSALLAVNAARSGHAIDSEPYVLLLVRPSGILGFYPAQRCLQKSNLHFGYDLVSDQQEFAKAEPADGEAEAVRAAVLASLMRRERYLAAAEDMRDRLNAIVAARRPSPQDVFRDRARPGESLDDQRRAPGGIRTSQTPPEPSLTAREPLDRAGRAFIPEGRFGTDPEEALPKPLNLHPTQPLSTTNLAPGAPSMFGPMGSPGNNRNDRAEDPGDEFDELLAAAESESSESREAQPANGMTSHDDFARPDARPPSWSRTDESRGGPAVADQSAARNGVLSEGQSLDEFWNHMQPLNTQPSKQNSPAAPQISSLNSQPPGSFLQNESSQASPPTSGTAPIAGRSAGMGSAMPLPPELAAALAAASAARAATTHRPVTILLDAEQIVVGSRPAMNLRGRSLKDVLTEVLQGLSEDVRGVRTQPDEVCVPLARFVVTPGANTMYLQLAAELYELNIPAGSMVSFDALPTVPTRPTQSAPARTERPRERRIHL